MKYFLTGILLVCAFTGIAQPRLVPVKNIVDKKWLTNQECQMVWYTYRDTVKNEVGKINTRLVVAGDKLTLITQVSLRWNNASWIDSSVASANDLRPLYHSSYNAQRDMALNFGKVVTGYYDDKTKKINTIISDTTR